MASCCSLEKFGRSGGQIFKKGSSIYLEGKIKSRNYEDKEGMKKYVTEIIAENLIMLDKPNQNLQINQK